MRKLLALLFAASFTFLSAHVAAGAFYRCNVNGSVLYQQSPCQSTEARRQPTVEELNADRARQMTKADKPTAPDRTEPLPGNVASPTERRSPTALLPRATSFRCDGRTHCSQMTSCAEAKYFLSNCPGVKMDGDLDGIPCEDQLCGH